MVEWKEVGGPCAQDEQNLHHDLVKHGNCWTSRILVRILYYSFFTDNVTKFNLQLSPNK